MSLTINTELRRYPVRKAELLQAWDAADELILSYLSLNFGDLNDSSYNTSSFNYTKKIEEANDHSTVEKATPPPRRILIINDTWGALTVTLAMGLPSSHPTFFSDSSVSHSALDLNLSPENGVLKTKEFSEWEGVYDLVLIRIPKQMSYLDEILLHLRPHLGPESKVVAGLMVKYQTDQIFKLFERHIGVTTTSFAKKKARLLFAHPQKTGTTAEPAKPSSMSAPTLPMISIPGFSEKFKSGGNLFSREKLDIGTRFFLENIPRGDFKMILDLGCGNGAIGILAKKLNPSARVVFTDDSYEAIGCARENYALQGFHPEDADFIWMNCFEKGSSASMDLVLCNPPFHQGNIVGDFIAHQMFRDSFRALRAGGTIRVVGNTPLRYDEDLFRVFGNVQRIAVNRKFSIYEAVKH